jgi:hypothetical protein
MIDRGRLDRDIERRNELEDGPAVEACERHIDAEVKARYDGGPDEIRIDLSGVSPAPTDRVMGRLVAAYSKEGTGFLARWYRKGAIVFVLRPAPIEAPRGRKAPSNALPLPSRRGPTPRDPWPDVVRPQEPHVWRHRRGPDDPEPTFPRREPTRCSTHACLA